MDWAQLPPLSMLRAFEAAARTGGFTAAGRELNVTYAAVSQQVRGLEDRLGETLMRREGRGVALTPAGRRLAQALGDGMETMRRGLAEFRRETAERAVQISLTPSFSASWLMPRIGGFRALHPDIELMLNPTCELTDLARSDFDLAIRFGAGAWDGVEAEPLVASSVVVVAAPRLLDAAKVETPADLVKLPWVQEVGTDEWRVWFAARGVEVGRKSDVMHMPGYMVQQALRDGLGVALVPRVFVEQDVKAGRLAALFDESEGAAPTGYHLVRAPGPMRAGVAAFVAWIRREAASETAPGEERAGGLLR